MALSFTDLFRWRPHRRTKALNTLQESYEWNKNRTDAAEKETQDPIKDLVCDVRDGIKGAFRTTAKLATGLFFAPLSIATNLGRWALDVGTKIPTRAALTTSDMVSEKTFGAVSRGVRNLRERISKAIDGESAHGAAHGAHGGDHGAAHGLAEAPAHAH
jgi:hypothetical protein